MTGPQPTCRRSFCGFEERNIGRFYHIIPTYHFEMDAPSDDDLVTIDRFIFIAEAEVARATLDAAGIDAVLADENIVRMAWGEAQAHGGVRLQVRRSDAEAAAEVLG